MANFIIMKFFFTNIFLILISCFRDFVISLNTVSPIFMSPGYETLLLVLIYKLRFLLLPIHPLLVSLLLFLFQQLEVLLVFYALLFLLVKPRHIHNMKNEQHKR